MNGAYGTFPNRNQTADFLAASSVIILACAHLRWQVTRHRVEAIGWMLGWSVVLIALFASYSRAGIIMLFAEVGLYLLPRSAPRPLSVISQSKDARNRTAPLRSLQPLAFRGCQAGLDRGFALAC